MTTATLDMPVLVLNRSWAPVAVASVAKAMSLLWTGAVKALDDQYQVFDFESWAALGASVRAEEPVVHAPGRVIKVPKIVVLQVFDKLPRVRVRFSRGNIYLRDNNTCQYCGNRFGRADLNLDHVIPRAQGGQSEWTNVVTSCVFHNALKADRTPEQAGLSLLRQPLKPTWSQLSPRMHKQPPKEWLPFIDGVSASYWNVDLDRT